MEWDTKLGEIAKQIKQGIKAEPVTARVFVGWFGAQRRSYWNVITIREALEKHDLVTVPDFESVWIDGKISFQNRTSTSDNLPDPTYRVDRLPSANRPPLSVKPDDPVIKAITLMVMHDYSQLPVMTKDRMVKGVITWSSLGNSMVHGKECKYVRDCMVKHKEIHSDTYIFTAVKDIIDNQYVLVRNVHNELICGIVTTSDLSLEFRQLGEPYLLLGEIENYIRRMIHAKFTIEELKSACESLEGREIESPSDLTLGEYQRLVENPDNWERLSVPVDRDLFTKKLDEIRRIRNDVMHFDLDPVETEHVDKLRDFVRLLQHLARMRAI